MVARAAAPVSSCVNCTPMPCVRLPCTPSGVSHTTLPCTASRFGIVHQRQQHEHFLAERVLARRGNEDAAALQERHVRGVQRRLLADVERQHAGARHGWRPVRREVVSCRPCVSETARGSRTSSDSATSRGCSGCATSARWRDKRPMIAKQRQRRHRGGERRERRGEIRIAQRRAARRDAREVGASMRRANRWRGRGGPCAPPSAPGFDARRQRHRRQCLRLGQRRKPHRRAPPATPGRPCASASKRRAAGLREHRCGIGDALRRKPCRAASGDGRGAASRRQRLRNVGGTRPG